MNDKTPPLSPAPEETPPKPARSEPVLRPVDEEIDLKVRNPLPWMLLAVTPLVLVILVAVVQGVRFEDPPAVREPTPAELNLARAEKNAANASRRMSPGAAQQAGVVSSSPVSSDAQAAPEEKAYACDFAPWVGLKVADEMLEALKQSHRPVRILPPGSVMTMDHSPARVNLDVDAEGRITRVWCG